MTSERIATDRGGRMPAPAPIERSRPYRLLVVANETLGCAAEARDVLERHGTTDLEVLVVSPALGGRLERWTSDDRPRRAAEERLRRCLGALRAAGVRAEGIVGDDDPLLAIDDSLRLFDADEILLATRPERSSGWLALDLVERARQRYAQRVTHVVVELGDPDAIAA
jgi:hypothetical protein